MFVRFRERINDGREPDAIAAELQCAGRCRPELRDRRAGPGHRYTTGCPLRPRCRWRIYGGLVLCRLLVALIENRRINGKVRQEHVADLGAIDGHWLPSFWAALSAERANAVRDNPWWLAQSIAFRSAFWRELEERLGRLSNRITAADADKVRASVQARIPRPSAADIEEIAVWNASEEAGRWDVIRKGYQDLIDSTKQRITGLEKSIEQARHEIAVVKPVIKEIDQEQRIVRERLAQGDRTIVDTSAEVRNRLNSTLLNISYIRAKRGY